MNLSQSHRRQQLIHTTAYHPPPARKFSPTQELTGRRASFLVLSWLQLAHSSFSTSSRCLLGWLIVAPAGSEDVSNPQLVHFFVRESSMPSLTPEKGTINEIRVKKRRQMSFTHQLSRLHRAPTRHHDALSTKTLRSTHVSGRHCSFHLAINESPEERRTRIKKKSMEE